MISSAVIHHNGRRCGTATWRDKAHAWLAMRFKDLSSLYVRSLAAPFTVNTMPEHTLRALAEHSELDTPITADGGDCEQVLTEFAKAGIDIDALAIRLQQEGAAAFSRSWNELLRVIEAKSLTLLRA